MRLVRCESQVLDFPMYTPVLPSPKKTRKRRKKRNSLQDEEKRVTLTTPAIHHDQGHENPLCDLDEEVETRVELGLGEEGEFGLGPQVSDSLESQIWDFDAPRISESPKKHKRGTTKRKKGPRKQMLE